MTIAAAEIGTTLSENGAMAVVAAVAADSTWTWLAQTGSIDENENEIDEARARAKVF